MIDKSTYTAEWLLDISKQHRNTDKILIEKHIRALTLLTELKESGLSFIFKGGTALMLMLNKPSRLSIDIDIIMENSNANLDDLFGQICSNSSFLYFTKNERMNRSAIEKAHYKFYYSSIVNNQKEDYVILDILYELNPYNKLRETPINSSFIRQNGQMHYVTTPDFEDILGDKLTAFAPNTTGIPYFKGETSMSMEIIKQLFDIGNLFDEASDISQVAISFETIAKIELDYRKMSHLNHQDVLRDIIQTSLCISTRGMAGECRFADIQHGLKRINPFIYSSRYVIEDAIKSASKAAYLAALILHKHKTINHYSPSLNFKDLQLKTTTYNKINKLKSLLTESFWYWIQIEELENQKDEA
jgi:predicted nucleotidyltransferase component of viral defense system